MVNMIFGKLEKIFGYGYGDGYGDGYGCWKEIAIAIAGSKSSLGTIAFWKSNISGFACNGGSSKSPAQPGLIDKSPGPLSLCEPGTLHATYCPQKWKGERLWLVAMRGEIVESNDKIGALEREIICEVKPGMEYPCG